MTAPTGGVPAGGAAADAARLDRIALTGLRVHGRHGVLPAERELGQFFVVDATLWLDTGPAAATDDLTLTVHYGELAQALADIVAGEPVELIETLAHRLVRACLAADPRVAAAEVTVHKPAAPITVAFTDVAVTVARSRDAAVTTGPSREVAATRSRDVAMAAGPSAAGASAGAGAGHAVVAIGSNIGDRLAHLRGAVRDLDAGLGVLAVSAVYETEPVGGPEQDDYLNAIVLVGAAPPHDLLAAARAAERTAARERTIRWGPRTLDVDIIACGDTLSDDPEILLPHPRAHERLFVCVPWLDVEPDAMLPGHGRVAELVARLSAVPGAAALRRTPHGLGR
ncbi:2-amino-4-hydroxy-6-hydroxymethyldihydropteridine diphosphokinase [Parafrankia sp. BMG5.11]|uniref:2-amino-4-hydroxy-6- hydroxymethyldihydropteridine diphosphokinase n=1 Tax=Parafrankia sp. BMG5.11 TaxID=222540 RepID=UPI00103CD0D9|nr:2-amino-4-hydroxy-6-hydroxymethyldihydropteridine diphosphokinase [Parafrankia sp. BMG5.11]TCJ35277.1 2-amino-4-hydroxy-6-hydroxymethyldihydropteridine diphosphokinase [Parafrankia sp. BMG5.11]